MHISQWYLAAETGALAWELPCALATGPCLAAPWVPVVAFAVGT